VWGVVIDSRTTGSAILIIDYLTGKDDWDILVGSAGRVGGLRIMLRAQDGERRF